MQIKVKNIDELKTEKGMLVLEGPEGDHQQQTV